MLLLYFVLFFSINLKSNIKLVSVQVFRWRWGRCAPYLNKKKVLNNYTVPSNFGFSWTQKQKTLCGNGKRHVILR